jgi:hypothetical protein
LKFLIQCVLAAGVSLACCVVSNHNYRDLIIHWNYHRQYLELQKVLNVAIF